MRGKNVSYSLTLCFAWFRVAKTGTRSITTLIKENVDDYVYLTRQQPIPDDLLTMLAGDCFRFTVVRNPWDRLVSGWRDKISRARPEHENYFRALAKQSDGTATQATFDQVMVKAKSFDGFLELLPGSHLFAHNIHFQPQAEILGNTPLDFVANFETFNKDVTHILGVIGLAHLSESIPHRNKSSSRNHYSEFYITPEAINLISKLYEKDIQRWGFEFQVNSQKNL